MPDTATSSSQDHKAFLASSREHILMLSTHGIHQWQVVPGLPDTGGQNVFVNQFSQALAAQGFKLTIVNRGGYEHPVTHRLQEGLHYKDEAQRILYLQDGLDRFVRKEDMAERVPAMVSSLQRFLQSEGNDVDLILSHYWDAAEVGSGLNRKLPRPVQHVWVPHSLGAIKKRNVSPQQWADLRIDERIATERKLVQEVDAIAATSTIIQQSLRQDYDYSGPIPFLPPCVDPSRYHPRRVSDGDPIWAFLSRHAALSPDEVRSRKVVTEISRTDTTKRKDVLIRAFAQAQQSAADSLLVVSIDEREAELASELRELMRSLTVEDHVAVVGSVWEQLPTLYAVTHVYCTPSVMEGFGMSAQEAAATGVPVVASDLVPFATEYLLGEEVQELTFDEDKPPLKKGEGAIVVPADEVEGFAQALSLLLSDDGLRKRLGARAHRITVPYFTWESRTEAFLQALALNPGRGEE